MTARGLNVEVRAVRTAPSRRPMLVAMTAGIALVLAQVAGALWPASGLGRFTAGSGISPPRAAEPRPAGHAPLTRRGSAAVPARRSLACTEPLGWRIASIETWPGGIAYVWRATDAAEATSPLDPSIPFMPVVTAHVLALGWCAPVDGPLHPPGDLQASAFRLDGARVTSVDVTLIPDVESGPYGAMWATQSGGRRGQAWPNGRYVIRIATADNGWVRWLGIDVRAYGTIEADPDPANQRMPGALLMS